MEPTKTQAQESQSTQYPPHIITAAEIIKLSDNFTIESIYIAEELYKKSLDAFTRRYPTSPGFAAACALGNIWEAGRIQGKRDERKRRKRK